MPHTRTCPRGHATAHAPRPARSADICRQIPPGLAHHDEATHRHAADSNRLVAEGALKAIALLIPAPLADIGRIALCALLDPPVRRACGLPDAPPPLACALARVGTARRYLPAW